MRGAIALCGTRHCKRNNNNNNSNNKHAYAGTTE
jgi:hypothetical protein